MSTTRSRAAKRPRTQTCTSNPAPAAPSSGVLLGGLSGDLAVQMLQRMHELDHLHDLNMYAPDDKGGLQLVTAHRLVVAAASERLEKTVARRNTDFKEGQPDADVYFDRGEFVGSMDACELRAIVSYAYGDAELRVAHKKLVGLSAAADFVGLGELSQLSADKAIAGLDASNAARSLQQAEQRGVQRVREASLEVVLEEFGAVCETEGFIRELSVELVCEVIGRDELRVEREEVVFEAVLRWLGAGVAGRGPAEATQVLKLVRFPLMEGLYLGTEVARCDAACVAGLQVLQKLMVEAVTYQTIASGQGAAGVEAAMEAGVVERSVRTRARTGMRLDPGEMECVKTVQTGHNSHICKWMVEVGEWVVTCGDGGSFKVWEQQGWTLVRTVHAGQLCLWSATECGGMLVTGGGNGSIQVWQAGSWTCVRTLQGHTSGVTCLLVLDDRRLLSCSSDGTVRTWNRTTWECERVVQMGDTFGATCLAAHNGMVYCGGIYRDPTIKVIDTATWTVVGQMDGHTDDVEQLAVWGNKVISCSFDKTIKVWSAGGDRACEQTIRGHTEAVRRMAVVGNKLVTGSHDKTLRVWGMRRGAGAWACERVLDEHNGAVTAMACTRDGRRLLTFDFQYLEEDDDDDDDDDGDANYVAQMLVWGQRD